MLHGSSSLWLHSDNFRLWRKFGKYTDESTHESPSSDGSYHIIYIPIKLFKYL